MGGGLAMGGQSESSDGDTDTGSIQISNTCCHLPGCVDRMVGGVEVEAYAVIQSARRPAAAAVLPCCRLAGADGGRPAYLLRVRGPLRLRRPPSELA